jgi:hypothetical protein
MVQFDNDEDKEGNKDDVEGFTMDDFEGLIEKDVEDYV